MVEEPSLHVKIINNSVYARLEKEEFKHYWYEQAVIYILAQLATMVILPDVELQVPPSKSNGWIHITIAVTK